MNKFLAPIFIFFICTINVAAQNSSNPIWVFGTVCFQDSTNYPYEVILKKDGNIIASRTFNKGKFKIETHMMPTSALVQSLGYEPVEKDLKAGVTHKNDTITFNNPIILEVSLYDITLAV